MNDLIEAYLQSIVVEVLDRSKSSIDCSLPFQDIGLSSFHVLKIIKVLELQFGSLPKTIMFENTSIEELADHFVTNYPQAVSSIAGAGTADAGSVLISGAQGKEMPDTASNQTSSIAQQAQLTERQGAVATATQQEISKSSTTEREPVDFANRSGPLVVNKQDLLSHSQASEIYNRLAKIYRNEGTVSRGVQVIAPYIFIGATQTGCLHFALSKSNILVYAYSGPDHLFEGLASEFQAFCKSGSQKVSFLSTTKIRQIGDCSYSSTPFGAMQPVENLQDFSLKGGKMRRLRYQVSKFEKTGKCSVVEHDCGSDKSVDKDIVSVINAWCKSRSMVNPLVYVARDEIEKGTFSKAHRVFLTYMDEVLQNVIIITSMSEVDDAYLMDLEFYPEDMPLGGLEYGIVQIIEKLASEGASTLSLGATFGPKLEASENSDPLVEAVLDELREQNIFNDEGNLQFKNKFRPNNQVIYLCRPAGETDSGDIIDLIMMIADPKSVQTADVPLPTVSKAPQLSDTRQELKSSVVGEADDKQPDFGVSASTTEKAQVLANHGWNVLNLNFDDVVVDLKTDSWAELQLPQKHKWVEKWLSMVHRPVDIRSALQTVFPFENFVFAESGRQAEQLFYEVFPDKGEVVQNLLFPTAIFHQINNGFQPVEFPDKSLFSTANFSKAKGDLDWASAEDYVRENTSKVKLVCIEISNNAAGGCGISLDNLKEFKRFLQSKNIPLMLDACRIIDEGLFHSSAKGSFSPDIVLDAVKEVLCLGDIVIASLSKNFAVQKGGIIALNDNRLYKSLVAHQAGALTGLDVIDKKIIAHAFKDIDKTIKLNDRRRRLVSSLRKRIKSLGLPTAEVDGGHCVLIDVGRIAQFNTLPLPAESFLAWLYTSTGIRASSHNVGTLTNKEIKNLVRLAVPIGVGEDYFAQSITALENALRDLRAIPVLTRNEKAPVGQITAAYDYVGWHGEGPSSATSEALLMLEENADIHATATAAESSASGESVSLSSAKGAGDQSIPPTVGSKSYVPVAKPDATSSDIAVVGLAGRYPKSNNITEFWKALATGKNCISLLSEERFKQRRKHKFSKRYAGGFLDEIDRFDSLFFNISPREAEMLDPQERLFLEVAWEALEDAGYYPETLGADDSDRNIGVYLGAVWAMYQMCGMEEKIAGHDVNPNSFLWSIANRVSYVMNFNGPSLTVDSACSSSLSALHLACEAISKGDCSAAIVGGVNIDVHQAKQDINHSLGALSADGLCKSFGQGADGYVPAEGVGAILVKPLDRALADGDNIHCVIKGAVINHGGRTSGYTVPSPKAQSALIRSALEKARIDARTIGYVEAHGTGTELGDPIEISGLVSAFETYGVDTQSCAIGSVKSNIGHAEAAAGIAGLSKAILQMKHASLAPSLHSETLNEHIDFANSPFYVPQKTTAWDPITIDGKTYPRRASISSFGAGGANAHVIIEEFVGEKSHASDETKKNFLFPLSAKSESQLKHYAQKLVDFLDREDDSQSKAVSLADISYTLKVGRKGFEHRVLFVANSKSGLKRKLVQYIETGSAEGVSQGHVKNSDNVTAMLNRREKEEFIEVLVKRRNFEDLGKFWVDGLLPDWQGVANKLEGKKVSLPTYPFADKRHWIAVGQDAVAVGREPSLHPLIDANASTFERQLFKKKFHEDDFFIYDHTVSGVPTLPGVAYLELVRKAGELAAGRKVRRINNILWVSPISVVDSKPVDITVDLKPSGSVVSFEVYSEPEGVKTLHSQGKLEYATEESIPDEYVDLDAIRARSEKAVDGKTAYKSFVQLGLGLGPSFRGVQEVFKNDSEILGVLQLPNVRDGDLKEFVLHPSLVDSSFQAGMAAQLGGESSEMFVPYTIGSVEIVHPLTEKCYSYVTEVKDSKKTPGKVSKVNVLIVDESGKVLVRLKDSIGIPLVDVHEKPSDAKGSNEATSEFSTLYFNPAWHRSEVFPKYEGGEKTSHLLVFLSDKSQVSVLSERCKEINFPYETITTVSPSTEFIAQESHYCINPIDIDHYEKLFSRLDEKGVQPKKICVAWSPIIDGELANIFDHEVQDSYLARGIYSLFNLCKTLSNQDQKSKIDLVYSYPSTGDFVSPFEESIYGFFKTLQAELARARCAAVAVLDQNKQSAVLDYGLLELSQGSSKDVLVQYEDQKRYVKRVEEIHPPAVEETSSLLRHKGIYLITGGLGGLGLIFAEYFATQAKANLILTGRSALSDDKIARISHLESLGSEVTYISADVSKENEVQDLIKTVEDKYGQLNGLIHAAGVLRDSYLKTKTMQQMQEVLAPKVQGVLNLDAATAHYNTLDFFLTFSSLAAIGGNAGQADYAYANHFMDSFVNYRGRLEAAGERFGLSSSINWPLWSEGGMTIDEQSVKFFRNSLGINPLEKEIGLKVFEQVLLSEQTQLVVIDGLRHKIEKAWGLSDDEPKAESKAGSQPVAESKALEDDQADEIVSQITADLLEEVKNYLKLDDNDKDPNKILLDFGFDSIGLTSFANLINEKYSLDLTPVLFFEYPSIKEISEFLATEHFESVKGSLSVDFGSNENTGESLEVESAVAEPPSWSSGINKGWSADNMSANPQPSGQQQGGRYAGELIAIVGVSGVFPQSDDVDEFWKNLEAEKSLITEIPRDRWKWEDYWGDPQTEENKTNTKWGGFMRELDKFDPLFFGISPREAELMDPQQRIFLQTVWKAVEDSGHSIGDISGTKTGLFVGVSTNEYSDLISHSNIGIDAYASTGNSHSVLVNRISYLLNLHGPSAPLDTACSSSLIALHRAIESIHSGSSEMAIVGGVQIMIAPAAHIFFGKAGMMADDGKCKTFDKKANGYVRGEGTGALFVKPLSKAEQDGDHIYAVVKVSAENHGGKANALTAPNPNAQSELLVEAYTKADIDPETVGYIECHGTGTALGDPIEIQALKKSFGELYKKKGKAPSSQAHCGLSSVKTNIGHLETAAGVAGLIKIIQSIKHKKIPASLNFDELNPYIDLSNSPFYVVDSTTYWQPPRGKSGENLPRRAGISSFGFGGANAHIVLEEYLPESSTDKPSIEGPHLFVLSAKNDDRLKDYVARILAFIEAKPDVDIAELTHTLQVGRDAMNNRLAIVVDSLEELKAKLSKALASDLEIAGAYIGNARKTKSMYQEKIEGKTGKAALQQLFDKQDLDRIAEYWAGGAEILLQNAFGDRKVKRIPLPTYPFARERYWLPIENTPETGNAALSAPGTDLLHPLVHQNTSTLHEQKFSSFFTGSEFFLEDHQVENTRILPGVAYMEMARVAGELSSNLHVLSVKNLTWLRPIIVAEEGVAVETKLIPTEDAIHFEVSTGAPDKRVIHSTGSLALADSLPYQKVLDVEAIKSRCQEKVLGHEALYEMLNDSGLHLGKSFQIVGEIYATETGSLATLNLPPHLEAQASHFHLHPSLMDGSLHTAIGLILKSDLKNPLSLPFSVAEVEIFKPLTNLHYGYATWSPVKSNASSTVMRVNIELLDKDGNILVRIRDLYSKPFSAEQLKSIAKAEPATATVSSGSPAVLHYFAPTWAKVAAQELSNDKDKPSKILFVRQDKSLDAWINDSGLEVHAIDIDSDKSVEDIQHAIEEIDIEHIVYATPTLRPAADSGIDDSGTYDSPNALLELFHLSKALVCLGVNTKEISLTVFCSNIAQVKMESDHAPIDSTIVGFTGSLAKENAKWKVRLLDLGDGLASGLTIDDCFSITDKLQGQLLAFRDQQWMQQSLEPVQLAPEPSYYRHAGVYVVIGGAGGLGEVWSRYMMEHYDAQLVWIGRRDIDSSITAKIESLKEVGKPPVYVQADAADEDSLRKAYESIVNRFPSIHGLVHSAVTLRDGLVANMSEENLVDVVASKVKTSINMGKVFGETNMDFVLFFSSIASFMSPRGQSNYAAGCAFKDHYAKYLGNKVGAQVKVVNWGYWGAVGVASDKEHNKIMKAVGIGSIEASEGMGSLESMLASDNDQIVIIKTLNQRGLNGLPISKASLSPASVTPDSSENSGPQGRDVEVKEITATTDREQERYGRESVSEEVALKSEKSIAAVQSIVTEKLASTMKLKPSQIEASASFVEFGVDSITGVNLIRSVNEALSIEMESIILFEHSSVESLANHIVETYPEKLSSIVGGGSLEKASTVPNVLNASVQSLAPSAESYRHAPLDEHKQQGRFSSRFSPSKEIKTSPENTASKTLNVNEPIAIIGISGRFAGSENLEQFWGHLQSGDDLVKKVDRWDLSEFFTSEERNKGLCEHGSFVDSYDCFDPQFFKISEEEATYMDPQQRIFLEESWKALEDAGYAGDQLENTNCGVYVGCGSSHYYDLMDKAPGMAFWGNSSSVLPARIAYYLNLKGPAIAVDTACSSSLVTIHMACQSLWTGENSVALAGGVFLQCTPGFYQAANRGGMLATSGRCASFDANADGFVPGEGVGVLVLKRLEDALADRDHIHGVISGSGINQDGASNGLIAPNPQAQERLERGIYERFNINPREISMVEAHGTGTLLGDAIEVNALTRAFHSFNKDKQYAAFGAVKSNIGHSATAAGVASVLKVLLSMKNKKIPASLHFDKANPAINFADSPFYVNEATKSWDVEASGTRKAAVSSFSFSGTNAHLVLEEALVVTESVVELPAYLIILSAQSMEQLVDQVKNLSEYLERHSGIPLTDISYTLCVGRKKLNHRFACVVSTMDELHESLNNYLAEKTDNRVFEGSLVSGQVEERLSLKNFGKYCLQQCADFVNGDMISAENYRELLSTIGDLYVQGYKLDLPAIFPRHSRRVSLPTYPFAKTRFWVDERSSRHNALEKIHPLLHRNTSDLNQNSYQSYFDGSEFFIRDHRLNKRSYMVSSVQTEMAIAALRQSIPDADNLWYEIHGMRWALPLEVSQGQHVSIMLFDGDSSVDFEVYQADNTQDPILSQGNLRIATSLASGTVDKDDLINRCSATSFTGNDLYADYLKSGIEYSDGLKSVEKVRVGQGEAVVNVQVPSAVDESIGHYFLHPSLLEGALQASRLLLPHPVETTVFASLPKYVRSFKVKSSSVKEATAWLRLASHEELEDGNSEGSNSELHLDIDLIAQNGEVVVEIRDICWIITEINTAEMLRGADVAAKPTSAKGVYVIADSTDTLGAGVQEQKVSKEKKATIFLKSYISEKTNASQDDIDGNTNLLDLGLTSIDISGLSDRIQSVLDSGFSPTLFFEYPTVDLLAEYLSETYSEALDNVVVGLKQHIESDGGECKGSSGLIINPAFPKVGIESIRSKNGFSLKKAVSDKLLSASPETFLHVSDAEQDIGVNDTGDLPKAFRKPLSNLLVTGANGFLGIHLIAELQKSHPKLNILCLVRAKDIAEGRQKVLRSAEYYRLKVDEKRLDILCGDITQKHLGLSDSHWRKCCETVEQIIHASAHVNHIQGYASFRPAVNGMLEVIKLAATTTFKRINFISSTAACMQFVDGKFKLHEKEDVLMDGANVFGGYGQSKWVQERLLHSASEKNVPYTVYRFGELSGSSETGIGQTEDMFHRLLQMKLAVGCREKITAEVIDIVPVNLAAAVISAACQDVKLENQVVHAAHPKPCPISFFYRWFQEKGMEFTKVSREAHLNACFEYIEYLGKDSKLDAFVLECALRSIKGSSKNTRFSDGYFSVLFPFNQDNFAYLLERSKTPLPSWDTILDKYNEYWSSKDSGFLDKVNAYLEQRKSSASGDTQESGGAQGQAKSAPSKSQSAKQKNKSGKVKEVVGNE